VTPAHLVGTRQLTLSLHTVPHPHALVVTARATSPVPPHAGQEAVAGIAPHVPSIVQAFGQAAVHPKLPDPTRTLLKQTVGQLRQHYAAQVDQLVGAAAAACIVLWGRAANLDSNLEPKL